MGFLQMMDTAGYHHAIVLSPATYAREMFPEDIATHEGFWKSEDAAWHLATQLMSRYSTLSVLGFRASFPVPAEVWTDATRLNACFFSQASRIIILVPSDGESYIESFTKICLGPLLTRSEDLGGRPNWRDRFVAAVIGNVRIPNELAPGIPFIKVVRFREIGWVRDITAMMLLHRAIQEFWVPTHAKSGLTRPYWNWAGGSAQSSCQLNEIIETKAALGRSTHVAGQMESIVSDPARSKSMDSHRSSSRRRHRQRNITTISRSRSRSQHSNSSGYRSLDPEFEAQQTEEVMIDTRVINILDGSQPIYLVDVTSGREVGTIRHMSTITKSEGQVNDQATKPTEPDSVNLSSSDLPEAMKENVKQLNILHMKAEQSKDDTSSFNEELSIEKDRNISAIMVSPTTAETKPDIEKLEMKTMTSVMDENSYSEDTLPSFSRTDHSEASTVIERKRSETEGMPKSSSDSEKIHKFDEVDEKNELKQDEKIKSFPTKSIVGTSISMVKDAVLTVNKETCGLRAQLVNKVAKHMQLSPILVSCSTESHTESVKSPFPPPVASKTKAKLIFSQRYNTIEKDQETSIESFPLLIDSSGVFEERIAAANADELNSGNFMEKVMNNEVNCTTSTQALDEQDGEYKPVSHNLESFDKNISLSERKHYWSVTHSPERLTSSVKPVEHPIVYVTKSATTEKPEPFDETNLVPMIKSNTNKAITVVPSTEEQATQFDQPESTTKLEPLSVVHHIPVVCLPTENQSSQNVVTVHEASTEPSLRMTSETVEVQTRKVPNFSTCVDKFSHARNDMTVLRKKHVSYSSQTITEKRVVSESSEPEQRSLSKYKPLYAREPKPISTCISSPQVATWTRSTVSDIPEFCRMPPATDQDLSSLITTRTTITPSGRVIYVRSATPSRISSKTFTHRPLLSRSLSTDQVRLAEPTILSGSIWDSRPQTSRPKVHVYPSPWRPIPEDTVADASTQMAGPLASGYMEGEGVRCYAFTGTHYCKRDPVVPRLIISKDTSVWTGPDATETYQLEVLFATRAKMHVSKEQLQLMKPSRPEGESSDPVNTQPSELVTSDTAAISLAASKIPLQSTPTSLSEMQESNPVEKRRNWTVWLFYIFSCFISLITLAVTYFCLRSDMEDNQSIWTEFWTWFERLSWQFSHQ